MSTNLQIRVERFGDKGEDLDIYYELGPIPTEEEVEAMRKELVDFDEQQTT